jgi:hypothetical protein
MGSLQMTRSRPHEMTERDAIVLTWIAEMYGADYEVLAVLLARHSPQESCVRLSESGVRKQVVRWVAAGWARVERALGKNWVTLTKAGYERVGLDLSIWNVPISRIRHCQNVNVLRLWYESQDAAMLYPWIPERLLWRQNGGGSSHVSDAEIRDPRIAIDEPPRYIGIEVEITHKARPTYADEVFARLRGGVAFLQYFVPDDAFAQRLQADLAAARQMRGATNVQFSVQVFPAVDGVSYQSAR